MQRVQTGEPYLANAWAAVRARWRNTCYVEKSILLLLSHSGLFFSINISQLSLLWNLVGLRNATQNKLLNTTMLKVSHRDRGHGSISKFYFYYIGSPPSCFRRQVPPMYLPSMEIVIYKNGYIQKMHKRWPPKCSANEGLKTLQRKKVPFSVWKKLELLGKRVYKR